MKKRLFSLMIISFLLLCIYTFPASAIEKEKREWQDETMYFLMVDRFNNGDTMNDKEVDRQNRLAYQGGDFKGIVDKLDKLKEIGFTTIVLTPIFQNEKGGYHGYWITNFYKINKQFGSIKEFKDLVSEAHDRNMKVLIDFPVTHVSTSHPWVDEKGKENWFTNKKDPVSQKWLGNMAALNLENNETKQELIKVAKWWVKNTNLDGYYLSNASGAPLNFWNDFSKEVKREKKDLFLLGESQKKDLKTLTAYEKTRLDGITYSRLNNPLRQQFIKLNKDSNETIDLLQKKEETFENSRLSANYLDSYKTERFTRDVVEEKVFPGARWKMALTYLYTIPGLPLVYYGSEIALNGGEGVDNHRTMDFRAGNELIDYITKLGELRQQLPALTRGTYESIYNKKGMTVFKREYKKETLIVAINNTSKTQKVTIPVSKFAKGKELRGLLAGDLVRPNEEKFTIILEREQSEIYALAKKTGINIPLIVTLATIYIFFILFIFQNKKYRQRERKKSA
ncbi:alpha-amylase family glycosyl hydrolase (plasmid) [Priestia megaterium]|uniref:alpha-amylase family glycosyl hydrolase n=1 Tax=Priestia TaxID=2800373 RepID=UPI00196A79B6|nr:MULTISPECIES: alpha-amylase family glycosyl hydrolase [Priestia]MCW1048952.1 alpha-amylase family glycosyl hydrolase [Priestia sp. JV24]QSF42173.1 alpha-glucosidase C-terminal domain-containing protein [Priestia megaterium]